ncbi:MAG: CvpA family protein [Tannerella sp.]|jgi:membrane protein required for colicin V production|nr:CvpA family protein [Tannerella sp.]
MNWLDITIICLAAAGFVKGCSDGFVRQIVMLIALVAAIYLCSAVAVYIREYIREAGLMPAHAVTVVSYVLAFLLILCVIALVGHILHKIMDVTPLSLPNHLAGGIFALTFTVLFISLMLNIIAFSDRNSVLIPSEVKSRSRLYLPVKRVVPAIYAGNLFRRGGGNDNTELSGI